MKVRQTVNGRVVELEVEQQGECVRYRVRGTPETEDAFRDVAVLEAEAGVYSVLAGTRSYDIRLERTHYGTVAQYRSYRILIEAMGRARNGLRNAGSGPVQLKAPMPGRVVRLLVEEGQEVQEGEGIAVLEAMKMQNEFTAPRSGVVRRLSIAEGATVSAGAILCAIE